MLRCLLKRSPNAEFLQQLINGLYGDHRVDRRRVHDGVQGGLPDQLRPWRRLHARGDVWGSRRPSGSGWISTRRGRVSSSSSSSRSCCVGLWIADRYSPTARSHRTADQFAHHGDQRWLRCSSGMAGKSCLARTRVAFPQILPNMSGDLFMILRHRSAGAYRSARSTLCSILGVMLLLMLGLAITLVMYTRTGLGSYAGGQLPVRHARRSWVFRRNRMIACVVTGSVLAAAAGVLVAVHAKVEP